VAKKTSTRKARAQQPDDTGELEVEEVVEAKPAKPPAGIETWLIAVTWAALVGSFVLIYIKMKATTGAGWPV
jgi:uncharacterized membrane-anchored protein YitT (DUF2179 family)